MMLMREYGNMEAMKDRVPAKQPFSTTAIKMETNRYLLLIVVAVNSW